MEWKIKDITGTEIIVTDLNKAIRECRKCAPSPFKLDNGFTVGYNYTFMLLQLLEIKKREEPPPQ